jgi:hypothetical protein
MEKSSLSGVFTSSLIFGLFMAIWFQTGISPDPQDLLSSVIAQLIKLFTPQYVILWYFIAAIISFISIVFMFYEIIQSGLLGIVSAFFGMVGGFLLPFRWGTLVGALLIIIGAIFISLI